MTHLPELLELGVVLLHPTVCLLTLVYVLTHRVGLRGLTPELPEPTEPSQQ